MFWRRSLTGSIFGCLIFLLYATIVPITDWQLVYHADRYHGHSIHHGMFFEGWYYNILSTNTSKTIVFIPGVCMNNDDRHAFLMIAYGNTSHYFRFPYESFYSSSKTDEFRISISREIENKNRTNIFSLNEIIIDVEPEKDDDATESIQMNITLFAHTQPKDISWLMPGTMGFVSWISFMQCYHHVISMRHRVDGTLKFGQELTTNISGIGYLEKDWGQTFPSTWIWGQANHWLSTKSLSASLFFSFAIVPMGLGIELPGFIVIFEHNKQFYQFSTQLLSIVNNLIINNNSNQISFTVYDIFYKYKLSVNVQLDNTNQGTLVYAPRNGRMEKFLRELLDSKTYFDVRLSKLISITTNEEKNKDAYLSQNYQEDILFEERTQSVAIEVNGDVIWLTQLFSYIYEKTFSWCFTLIRTFIQYYKSILLLPIVIYLVVKFSNITSGSI